MKNLMKQAHEITKEMVNKYPEADYQAQLGLTLSYLHKEAKEMEFKMKKEIRDFEDGMLLLLASSNRYPTWLAEITGTDSKYGFKRDFINDHTEVVGRCLGYKLDEGSIYNWKNYKEQQFGIMENGTLYEITKQDVEKLLAK